MSVRPERLKRDAESFRLKEWLCESPPTLSTAPSSVPSAPVAAAPATPLNASKLSFTFNLPQNHAAAAQATAPFAGRAAPSALTASNLPNLTFSLPKVRRDASSPNVPQIGMLQASAPGQHVESHNEDTMRLAGMLDEARTKLGKMQIKLTATEASVARANQALTSERASATARLGAVGNELKAARESEKRLRSELAASPARAEAERQKEAFEIATRGALELECEHEQLQLRQKELAAAAAATEAALEKLRIEHEALVNDHEATCTQLGEAQAAVRAQEDTPVVVLAPPADDLKVDEAPALRAAAIVALQAAADLKLEELRAELTAKHEAETEARVAVVEQRVVTLEDLLLETTNQIKEATEARAAAEAARTESELGLAALAADLPEHTTSQLDVYAELRARAEAMDPTGPQYFHARERAAAVFASIATGEPVKKPEISHDVGPKTAPPSETVAFLNHALNTSSKCCSGTVATIDLDLHAYSATGGKARDNKDKKEGDDNKEVEEADLTEQSGRVKAAIAAISADLKSLFKNRQETYSSAISTLAIPI